MNKLIMTLGLLVSVSASADSFSQKTAMEMVKVLQSHEVSALLSQEQGGVGNIQGIKYLYTARASFGPAVYEVSFSSYSGGTQRNCTVAADINIETEEVMALHQAICN